LRTAQVVVAAEAEAEVVAEPGVAEAELAAARERAVKVAAG
jgi:hypothetical protein